MLFENDKDYIIYDELYNEVGILNETIPSLNNFVHVHEKWSHF